jgi:hypothetical protein
MRGNRGGDNNGKGIAIGGFDVVSDGTEVDTNLREMKEFVRNEVQQNYYGD